MSTKNCAGTDTGLQDYVDGVLPAEQEARVRRHLAECLDCRREEQELRRLLTRVAELPRAVEPRRELWAGVAERLMERSRLPDSGSLEPRRRAPHSDRSRRWRSALAALLFMALGALLARIFPASPPAEEVAPESGLLLETQLASSAGLTAVESDYLKAKEALWLVVVSRHEELSPATLETVRTNLLVIDAAIRDLREALEKDPGNPRLESHLLAQHRRSIGLLKRLAAGGIRRSPSSSAAHI